jgi:hypothetical protein
VRPSNNGSIYTKYLQRYKIMFQSNNHAIINTYIQNFIILNPSTLTSSVIGLQITKKHNKTKE